MEEIQQMRVGDYIAKRLAVEGIDRIFLLSGGGMMHLLDALTGVPKIKVISQHHEQCCGFAADGYARVTGKFGVCYGTSGPGASNLVTSVVNSYQDSIPVLFISGQSKLSNTIQHSGITGLRQFGTFEVDIVPIVKSITKYSHFLTDPHDIDRVMDEAISSMLSGRPGPAFIDIPVDLQGALVRKSIPRSLTRVQPLSPSAPLQAVTHLLESLKKFKRPLLLAGHGVRMSNSAPQFRQFVEMLKIPVAITPMASDLLEYDHPLLVGRPGVKGDRSGNISIQNADCIISLGCSLHAMTTGYELDKFAPNAHKIQIEFDPAIQAREAVGFQEKHSWLVQDFLTQALSFLSTSPSYQIDCRSWLEHCQMVKKDLDPSFEPHKTEPKKMNYYDVIFALNEALKEGDTLVVDAGLPFYLVGHAFKVKKNQRIIIPGALGQMGYALPAATGIATAKPDSTVYVLIGDGSFQTNVHELAVYKHLGLNIKTILVNNNGYVSIRNTQKNYFEERYIGTDPEHGVSFPDHKTLSAAYSLGYESAREKLELAQGLQKMSQNFGPEILEVYVSANQEVIPSVQSERLPDGRMVSKQLHDMYPYLTEDRLKKYYLR